MSGSRTNSDEHSRLNAAIYLILCILPLFATLVFGAVDNTTWILLTVLWIAIILMWVSEAWQNGEIELSGHSLQIPLLCLLAIGLVQLLPLGSSGDIGGLLSVPVSSSLSLDPHATRFFVSRLAVYIVFFAACLTFFRGEDRLRKVIITIIIFGSMMAFFGILQRLANPDGIYGLRETPQAVPFGPFVNQHHFASLMQMTGGLTLGWILGSSVNRDKKILLAIAFILMSIAILLTGSRGGLIGLISVILVVIVFQLILGRWSQADSRTRASKLKVTGVIAAAGIGVAAVVFGIVFAIGGEDSLLRGIGMSTPNADLTGGRIHFWNIALKMFLEHPVLGVGFDAFGVAFTRYDTWSGLFRVEQAHNEYLQILAEGGIPGFLCVIAFIFLLLRGGLKSISGNAGISRDASIGALAGCLGILVHSFFDFPLRTPSNGFFFLMLCVIAVSPVRSAKKQLNGP